MYEAVQVRLNRRFAVKLLTREAAGNPEALARFRREAEVTAKLAHPHIIQVADYGATDEGDPYLVMEYLDGEDLEQRLRRVGRFNLASAVRVVHQVASAVSASHSQGIVHRDLKPANIFLLDIEGEPDFVKVVDFGISKFKRANTQITGTSVLMGTPSYMPPEQATGKSNSADHRADQWALAVVAWEMLTGHPPFVRKDVTALLHAIAHEELPRMTDKLATLPAEVETTLRRALAKRPGDRFPTVGAFARAFETAAASPLPASRPHRRPRLRSRRPRCSASLRRPRPVAAPRKRAARPATRTLGVGPRHRPSGGGRRGLSGARERRPRLGPSVRRRSSDGRARPPTRSRRRGPLAAPSTRRARRIGPDAPGCGRRPFCEGPFAIN